MNNLRLAFRHLGRQSLNTTFHIVGLTLGMSACLLIGLFLRYELSFDTFHDLADQTYRINSIHTFAGQSSFQYASPLPLADALRKQLSGREKVALAHPQPATIVDITPGKRFEQEHILITEPELLDIFNIKVLSGNGRKALQTPYQALLTETTAKKFYGNGDPLGKTFLFKKKFTITVAGIIQDMPYNTHLPASMLISYLPDDTFLGHRASHWTTVNGTSTFVVLPDPLDIKKLQTVLADIEEKNINSRLEGQFRMDFEIQPLRTIHFDTKYNGGYWVKAVNPSWLWFFAGIGLSILLLACINFVNLSTAQAITRAKEIGIRKSIGAGKFNLVVQFLREAFILCFIAGILSIAVVQLALPFVNTLLEKNIPFDLFESILLPGIFIAGILMTTLLAGLYPAWIISKFNPVITLKGNAMHIGNHRSLWVRKGLIVIQFTLSTGLLITVLFISQQVKYLRNKNLGFEKDNIINITLGSENGRSTQFASALNQIPGVKDFSFACAAPGGVQQSSATMSLTDFSDPNQIEVNILVGDDQFCPMYGLELLAGRFPLPADTNYVSRSLPDEKKLYKIVLNEKAVKALGFKSNEASIGQRFGHGHRSGRGEIIGVVADFNSNSLHETLMPVMITQDPELYGQVAVKIKSGTDIPEIVAAIESAWKKVYPDDLFHFQFLDQQIDSFYKAEVRLYTLFKIFSAVAILISCLGLWGLSAFSAQRRTKEIGVRKVLGASANAIVLLLSKEFLFIVIIALAIASPLTYFGMRDWLQHFAYRIDIGWSIFMLAGTTSLLIALMTVSIHAIRAALANPVKSLRSE